jgi:hypothetical protein
MASHGTTNPPDDDISNIDPDLLQQGNTDSNMHGPQDMDVDSQQLELTGGGSAPPCENDQTTDEAESDRDAPGRAKAAADRLRKQRQRKRALQAQENEEAELRDSSVTFDWESVLKDIGKVLAGPGATTNLNTAGGDIGLYHHGIYRSGCHSADMVRSLIAL